MYRETPVLEYSSGKMSTPPTPFSPRSGTGSVPPQSQTWVFHIEVPDIEKKKKN